MNENKLNINTHLFGDYVLCGIPNAFSAKTSYWLSKKGMTVSMYCFTIPGADSLELQLECIGSYIKMFQEKYETQTIQVFVKEEYVRDSQIYLGQDIKDGFWCMGSEIERCWRDAEAPLLLLTFTGISLEEAQNRIFQEYPKANKRIFEFCCFTGDIK